MTTILGISAGYHDAAACLVRDGVIVAAAQEERFTRRKHDPGFPTEAIAYCLAEGGLQAAQLDWVGFYDKPLLTFERLLENFVGVAPRGRAAFVTIMPSWMKEKLFMRRRIRRGLASYRGPIAFTEHHESHAAAAFYPSPFEAAAVLTIDGVGEWATASWGVGRGRELELRAELRYPHSLGLLYSAFTYFSGFKVNSGEYKLMGLAPYGEPRYLDVILERLVRLKDDGSFKLNMDYFDYHRGLTMTNGGFAQLFGGPPRAAESEITQREMDLAASVQRATEEIMLRMARHVHATTGMENLCLAGGVALNCVANGRLLRDGPFRRIWVQPAAGDAGSAVGVALAIHHRLLGAAREVHPGRDGMQGTYLGPAFSDAAVAAVLDSFGAAYETLVVDALVDRTARLLADGKVVGWFQGRMEFGPRALGNRSILGDPRSPEMQSLMNRKIKFRESFRPFAPSVPREHAAAWFELEEESPYMLLVAPVRRERRLAVPTASRRGLAALSEVRSVIPAVTHVDDSARVQTVSEEMNPLYHALLTRFHALTGCPVLVNTSFNVRGEPIVCTPRDAYRCFLRTGIDHLVVGRHILARNAQPPLAEEGDWRSVYRLD
jgi:carbamoyltransferase